MKDKLEQTFLLTLTGNAKLKLSIVVEHWGLIFNAAASSTNLIRPSQSFRKGLTKTAKNLFFQPVESIFALFLL